MDNGTNVSGTQTGTDNGVDSLESPTTVVAPAAIGADESQNAAAGNSPAMPIPAASAATPNGPVTHESLLRRAIHHINIYMLLFVLVLIVAGATAVVFYLKANNGTAGNTPPPQTLSQSTLDQLSSSDVTVGEPKHTLSVQSNAVFTGDVLVRSNLQIAGTLQVGSDLAINGIRVTGNSTFDDVQVTKSLAVTGNESIQGQLNVKQGLDVDGTGTFLGALSAPSLSVGSLQLSGDLDLTRHIAAGGGTPARSNGAALGGGGTVSVSGSDTAGSVTINTGGNPGPGCFVTVAFTTKFNATPHVVVTPVGSAAAGLSYYINRSTSNFSICTTTSAPAGATFGFDYLAFD